MRLSKFSVVRVFLRDCRELNWQVRSCLVVALITVVTPSLFSELFHKMHRGWAGFGLGDHKHRLDAVVFYLSQASVFDLASVGHLFCSQLLDDIVFLQES